MYCSWLRKYADDGFLAERYKPKWFILTKYFLAYMDWEGAPVKRQWGLSKAKFTRLPCDHCERFHFKTSNGGILDLACYNTDEANQWQEKVTELIKLRNADPLGENESAAAPKEDSRDHNSESGSESDHEETAPALPEPSQGEDAPEDQVSIVLEL